jgi:tritrans,polycis-undecaprenyl-diphosphate synthase [geranylgeranyl-diphosphate specific]
MSVPKHVGFIMDGNRRFAKRLMAKPWKGHEWGSDKLRDVLDWCKDAGVEEVTVYAFSIQNFNRPQEEFDYIMDVFESSAQELIDDPSFTDDEHGVRINFIGRLHKFPDRVEATMRELMERTQDNDAYVLNIAVAYGGREEVLDAVKRVSERVQKGELDIDEINEASFSDELYMQDEPDLIIRTGGERRTSNFLAWQSTYSEWIFIDKMWPEFSADDFSDCLAAYEERERRFGR